MDVFSGQLFYFILEFEGKVTIFEIAFVVYFNIFKGL